LRYASVDYFSYWTIYDNVKKFSNLGFLYYVERYQKPLESGFAFLILLEKVLFGHYFVFIGFFSCLSLSIKYKTIKMFSPYFTISVLVYCAVGFMNDMGQIRSAIAGWICLFSVIFVYKHQKLRFFVTIYVAILFHTSAIVGFIIYFLPYIGKRRLMMFSLVLAVVIAVFGGSGTDIVTKVGVIFGLDKSFRIIRYMDSVYATGFRLFGGTFLNFLILSCLMLLYYKQLISKWKYNSVLIPMYIYGTVLSFLSYDYGIISARIKDMLCLPSIVVILPTFLLIFRKDARFIPYTIIIIYCVLWSFLAVKGSLPYQSILQFLL
jgi:hypothetical protein